MPTVWFIRHGESLSNAGRFTLSPEFTGLTSLGIKQAEAIARAFPRSPSLIVMSKYRRTEETAQPTIRRFPDAMWEKWPNVHEFTYLSWSHSKETTEQGRQKHVERFWQRKDPLYADGEGETFTNFISRVSGALERLRYNDNDFIAVFTHGYFIRAAWWYLQTRPERIDSGSMEEFYKLRSALGIPNGTILPVKLRGREDFSIEQLLVPPLPSQRKEAQKRTAPVDELRLLAAFNVGLSFNVGA
jgi:broad specificity phosphatase PhoE